jgi:hypothetical protein
LFDSVGLSVLGVIVAYTVRYSNSSEAPSLASMSGSLSSSTFTSTFQSNLADVAAASNDPSFQAFVGNAIGSISIATPLLTILSSFPSRAPTSPFIAGNENSSGADQIVIAAVVSAVCAALLAALLYAYYRIRNKKTAEEDDEPLPMQLSSKPPADSI